MDFKTIGAIPCLKKLDAVFVSDKDDFEIWRMPIHFFTIEQDPDGDCILVPQALADDAFEDPRYVTNFVCLDDGSFTDEMITDWAKEKRNEIIAKRAKRKEELVAKRNLMKDGV